MGGLLFLPAASFLVAFWPVVQKLSCRWDSGDDSYGYLIVPLFLYLCWERRASFRFNELSWNSWGLLPVLAGAASIILGELASVETLLYIGLWAAAGGIAFIFYGSRARMLAFPLTILFFITPLPPFVNRLLTFKLKMLASTLSVQMMRLSGLSVLQEGNIIDLGMEKLQVVDACSGLRYVMPMLLMALLIGHFFTRGWWRRAVLVLLILPLSVLINGLRIYVTGLLTVNGHAELAQDLFHDAAGLFIFLAAGAVLVGLAMLLRRVGQEPAAEGKHDPGGRWVSTPFAATLVVLITALFLGSGWALRTLPALQAAMARSSFESFPMVIAGWQGERAYLSPEILNALWADDYVNATFHRDGQANQIYLLIPYYASQSTRHTVHAPQSCLLGGGWTILQTRDRTVPMANGTAIPVRTMLLAKGDARILANYFFSQRGRVLTSPWWNKFYLMYDAVTRRRTDGALVRVEMSMAPGQAEEQALGMVDEFLAGLWPVLPEYIPQ